MKLLVLDTETTGLNPHVHKTIEIACCLYSTTTKTILRTYQTLIYSPTNECEHINRISVPALAEMKDFTFNPLILKALSAASDYIIAHNAQFDKKFVEVLAGDLGTQWVCSKSDIQYPNQKDSKRLGYLCYDHNIPFFNAHSALSDVHALIELLKCVPNLEDQINGLKNSKAYRINTPYDKKNIAKSAGFIWDRDKGWIKRMTTQEVEKMQQLPELKEFEIKEIV